MSRTVQFTSNLIPEHKHGDIWVRRVDGQVGVMFNSFGNYVQIVILSDGSTETIRLSDHEGWERQLSGKIVIEF